MRVRRHGGAVATAAPSMPDAGRRATPTPTTRATPRADALKAKSSTLTPGFAVRVRTGLSNVRLHSTAAKARPLRSGDCSSARAPKRGAASPPRTTPRIAQGLRAPRTPAAPGRPRPPAA